MRPESALAGLPRLVRLPAELRWRGGTLLGMAACVVLFWLAQWLLGEPVRPGAAALGLAAVAIPTAVEELLAARARLREALAHARRAPRASVHETVADARERRTLFAAALLTAVVALLILDHLIGGGGVLAGLAAGACAALGAVDLREARRIEAAEETRESRLFVLLGPRALIGRFGVTELYEAPRPRALRPEHEPSPFDLGV